MVSLSNSCNYILEYLANTVSADIFGFFPQTLQGADILAYGDKEREYQVFMPDFFDGKPADISWYPPDTDDKGKKLGEFFNVGIEKKGPKLALS